VSDDGAQTLERGLAVLVELTRHREGMTTAQAAVACGLHRSVTQRLLVSLRRTGFAERDAGGRWHVGPVATGLAGAATPRLRDVAQPVLHRLAHELDATVILIEVDGEAAVTTVVAEPPTHGPRFSYRLGSRDPLDRGAGGLAALASGPPQADEPERVAAVRERGVVSTYAELHPGAHGIAAPVTGWGVLAAVTVVTAREELAVSAQEPVRRAAAALSEARPPADDDAHRSSGSPA